MTAVDPQGYPPDLGTGSGRIVIDNSAPALDGDRYTLSEVVKPPPAPTLAALYPATFVIGSPNTLLHCFGGPFSQEARIVLAGNVERTTFVSTNEVTTWIDAALWTNPDPAVPVKVRTQNGDTPVKTLAISAT